MVSCRFIWSSHCECARTLTNNSTPRENTHRKSAERNNAQGEHDIVVRARNSQNTPSLSPSLSLTMKCVPPPRPHQPTHPPCLIRWTFFAWTFLFYNPRSAFMYISILFCVSSVSPKRYVQYPHRVRIFRVRVPLGNTRYICLPVYLVYVVYI